ncbi:MAG: hypothetical protein ISN29_07525, partial [Gammaproteobacteria bacterium AqS3]|nr:hypothetical protein [Gammaproteobacteria bacterium AqS3]
VVLDAAPPPALAADSAAADIAAPECAGLYVILAADAAERAPMQGLYDRLERGGVEMRLHRITPRK